MDVHKRNYFCRARIGVWRISPPFTGRPDCKIFCVLDIYAQYDLDVRGRGEGGFFQWDDIGQGGGGSKKPLLVGRLMDDPLGQYFRRLLNRAYGSKLVRRIYINRSIIILISLEVTFNLTDENLISWKLICLNINSVLPLVNQTCGTTSDHLMCQWFQNLKK